MMSPEIQVVEFTEIVGELEIPCDYGEYKWCRGEHPARWAATLVKCGCGAGAGTRLICTICKDTVMSTDAGMECAVCDNVVIPARHIFARIEAL